MPVRNDTESFMVSPDSTNHVQDPEDLYLMSFEVSEWFMLINFCIICCPICLCGIAANIINIMIFVKQGFSVTVNISLCGLAISDLLCLVTQLWYNICMSPALRHADIPFSPVEVHYLTGSIPAYCFARISGWIIVFITAERCISIALPLKVKQIITQKNTTIIISTIFIVNFLAISPEYRSFYLTWKFDPERNKTLYGMSLTSPDEGRTAAMYVLTALLGYTSFIALVIFTAVLVVKLRQKSAWRKQVTVASEQSDSMSSRDRKTVKMIVLIACIMIICYTPGSVMVLYMFFDSRFSVVGQHQRTFLSAWSFCFIFQTTNSSVNIVLYYRMSSKFRETFDEMFAKCMKKPEGKTSQKR